jgi:hypothetical protein
VVRPESIWVSWLGLGGRSIADTACSSKPLRGLPDLWVLIGGAWVGMMRGKQRGEGRVGDGIP